MTDPRIHRFGNRALLVALPDLETVMSWHAALSSTPLPGQVDCVAAARTVLLTFESSVRASAAVVALESFDAPALRADDASEITIDVVYDGEDLASTAQGLGMTPQALIDWHTSTPWLAAFGGFAPGFTYCVPADPAMARPVPRRESPRVAVPERAVGLADDFSAIYPRTSPGGWKLIGTANDSLWDASQDSPALIVPGDTVHYHAVRERIDISPTPSSVPVDQSYPALRVNNPGLFSIIEDLGRPSHGSLGVTDSGAADRSAAFAANSAVGNGSDAAVIEIIGGCEATALVDTVVAVSGSVGQVAVDDQPRLLATPLLLTAGSTLAVSPDAYGLRSYLAIRGGISAPEVLNSASYDALSGLGPRPLVADQIISTTGRAVTVGTTGTNPRRIDGNVTTLRCVAGPRDDWFTGRACALSEKTWTVTPQSNRVGVRLEGQPLIREHEGELPSEGMVAGAVQVPPNGLPVVFLRDHAVTGGYPVIATVVAEDLDLAGQLPPGASLRFQLVDPDTLAPLMEESA